MYISICLHFFAFVYIYICFLCISFFIYTPGFAWLPIQLCPSPFQVKEINLDTDVEISKCSFMRLGGFQKSWQGRDVMAFFMA